MSEITICFLILGISVVLFISQRIPVELVAIGVALSLYFTKILGLGDALSGFGDPTVIFIASLFVVSEGLDASGVTTWVGQKLVASAGSSGLRLLVFTMLISALLTALINPNGAVAALLPVAVVVAIRLGRSPSELLLPTAFAAHAGSMLALTGTPVNVIVSKAAVDAGARSFGFLEFSLVGIPLVLGTIAITVLLGPRLIPHRTPRSIPTDFSKLPRELKRQYTPEPVFRLNVGRRSPLVGMSPSALNLKNFPGITVIGGQAGGRGEPVILDALAPGDVLVVQGDADQVNRLAGENDLAIRSNRKVGGNGNELFTRESGVAEVVIPPRSGVIGEKVFPGMVSSSGDLIVLAVQRGGEDVGPNQTTLDVGDTLLLQGTWEALHENLDESKMLVVDSPELVQRQLVPMGASAKHSLAALVGLVILLATGVVPAAVATLLAACAMILLRVIKVQQAYQSISWTTIVLIAGMIPLSTAMEKTGAADKMAMALVNTVGQSGPYALLLGLFVLTAVLGQLISNTATALIIIPVAVSAAAETHVSVRPLLMAVTVAAAASFLTPIATPANIMVMEPGGYRFGDYWKFGLTLLLWFLAVTLLLIPLIWRF